MVLHVLLGRTTSRARHTRRKPVASWPDVVGRPTSFVQLCATSTAAFYSSLRGPSYRVANDLRHCVLRRLTPPFVFLLFGTSCPRQRSVGLEGAGGPVGFEPVAGKRGVILAPCSSASGLVTAVDSTMLVSSSRRPAPVNRLSLPWAPCFAHKKIKNNKGKWWVGVFELGSVVRRTEPHVRYLLLDSVRGSCLSLFSCVTSIFRCGFLVSHSKARKHGPVGRPAVPPSS